MRLEPLNAIGCDIISSALRGNGPHSNTPPVGNVLYAPHFKLYVAGPIGIPRGSWPFALQHGAGL
jgi:hypothetical protein